LQFSVFVSSLRNYQTRELQSAREIQNGAHPNDCYLLLFRMCSYPKRERERGERRESCRSQYDRLTLNKKTFFPSPTVLCVCSIVSPLARSLSLSLSPFLHEKKKVTLVHIGSGSLYTPLVYFFLLCCYYQKENISVVIFALAWA
jgi:hypothetical protein